MLGAEAAETIDWRRPRMVCIAAGFSHHDRVAVQRLRERIDLVRYLIFDGGLLGLLLVDSPNDIPSAASSRRERKRPAAFRGLLQLPRRLLPECLRDLYTGRRTRLPRPPPPRRLGHRDLHDRRSGAATNGPGPARG